MSRDHTENFKILYCSAKTSTSIIQSGIMLAAVCATCGADIFWNANVVKWYCSEAVKEGSTCRNIKFEIPEEAGSSELRLEFLSDVQIQAWVCRWIGEDRESVKIEVEY